MTDLNSSSFIVMAIAAVAAYVLMKRLGRKGRAPASVVREKIAAGAKIVDVRTPEEYSGGAFPRAKNIPLSELQSRMSSLGPKDKPVILYCASGSRSSQAARILRQAGFLDVIDAGGLGDMPR